MSSYHTREETKSFGIPIKQRFESIKNNYIHTLSKKHCGRKDNLGRELVNCNFSEPRAGTVSALISMGLLDNDFKKDLQVLPCKVHKAHDFVHWRQFVLDLAIVGQSTQHRFLSNIKDSDRRSCSAKALATIKS